MARILDKVKGPKDLKRLSLAELEQLCGELREEITSVVSKTGGHLAPNLGVVELTVALHYVFESPKDKIIFDVGHQCYAHKLLTGRKERFHTLRQYGGISGFPRREESPHDPFGTGHGSTSISAALGFAVARDLKGGNESIVAVIGDGSLTGGMAYEALNNAGMMKRPLIVVLNDNQMAISPSVGAMAQYLARIRSDPHYLRAKRAFEELMRRLPLGQRVVEAVERLKASIKHLLVPGMLFEELGFTYLGPVDGHDLRALIRVLNQAKRMKRPVLVHVVTKKGKGYEPAERDATKFHGVPPFDVRSGKVKGGKRRSYTEVFSQALIELACKDERIVAITAAMPSGTGLDKFGEQFPDRFFDVGMAEEHAVTFAAGLAASGMKPVVAIYSTFLQRAYDQIV
ncbi:MAG TPA: 1-deoxy-D-xylulose-5-phosphate synthase, partial [Armatimonadetes bacterium]|nr:1-deoxy-D-xylulose-5-phosphate synthase [Armatimonadota bacterium]